MKTGVNVPSKSNQQKNFDKKPLFFVGNLSASEGKSRIRIRNKMSLIQNTVLNRYQRTRMNSNFSSNSVCVWL
jgi:hypothetical protein